VVTHPEPEIVGGCVGLGGDRVDDLAADSLAKIATVCPGSGQRDPDVDDDRRRRRPPDDLPTIDRAAVVAGKRICSSGRNAAGGSMPYIQRVTVTVSSVCSTVNGDSATEAWPMLVPCT